MSKKTKNHIKEESLVVVTKIILLRCGVERETFKYWLKTYTVNGQPLGCKIGGRWRVYLSRLEKFMHGIRDEIPRKKTEHTQEYKEKKGVSKDENA